MSRLDSHASDRWTLESPEETRRLGEELSSNWSEGDCLSLIGPLGAGKTTFVKGTVEGLGGTDSTVRSPTYALVQRYPETDPQVVHADLYRTEGPDQQETIGLEEYFATSLTMVEWGERWSLGWPEPCRTLLFVHRNQSTREIGLIERSPEAIDDAVLESVFPSEGVLD
ncbi:MAG: tRNA (adenosine(37)-N6)-threonylcarbamoyltransferase complex ATPase subunit type 1 TsaE [bacterium]